MPLQNRVDPFGELFADSSRGLLLGNRGGRFHRDDRTLGRRRFASHQWICCVLDFRGRHRDAWGKFYTELFFLDEVTALAAGHRPCFECRRQDATDFAGRWARAFGIATAPRAPVMDAALHAERLDGRAKRRHSRLIDGLPDGAVVVLQHGVFALRGRALLPWISGGYGAAVRRPSGTTVDVLTPPTIVAVLADGYRPLWHPSAEASLRIG